MHSEAYVLIITAVGEEDNVLREVRKKDGVKEAYRTDRIYDIIARVSVESTEPGITEEEITERLKRKIEAKYNGIRSVDGIVSTLTMASIEGWKKNKDGITDEKYDFKLSSS